MPAPHVAPARRQLPLGVRTKRACARRRGGCWASRSRLCATWQRRPSRSRTAATRRWPAMRRASRPSWAARRPSLCRRWRRVRTLLYPIPMRTPPPPPAASRRDSVRARCESQAEGRRAEGATFQIAGMLVHAGGLLVRAEQWRRAGNLDDLDLAATRVGRAGQALVRVRGPLVLRSVQTPAVLVTVRQISAPASYAAGGRLFGHALRLPAVRGLRATPGHCATCQTGRGRSL